MCLLGIGGAPYVMAQKPKFSTSCLKPPADGASYYARRFPRPRPLQFVKIIVKLHLQAFWQNFEN